MIPDVQARRRNFRALHEKGCFVLPNPWSLSSARRLEELGFKALASTSSGAAEALGRRDGELGMEEVLSHLTALAGATTLPLNGDFEAGFADDPEEVARNVSHAIKTGVSGLSIEDRKGDDLYETTLAVERVAAARKAILDSREDVVLVARTEGYLLGREDLSETIARLAAMAAAGADCVYAPGMRAIEQIEALVRAVAPTPVNVLLMGPDMRVSALSDIGVRRVSTGGALSRLGIERLGEAAEVLLSGGLLPT